MYTRSEVYPYRTDVSDGRTLFKVLSLRVEYRRIDTVYGKEVSGFGEEERLRLITGNSTVWSIVTDLNPTNIDIFIFVFPDVIKGLRTNNSYDKLY